MASGSMRVKSLSSFTNDDAGAKLSGYHRANHRLWYRLKAINLLLIQESYYSGMDNFPVF